MTSRRTWRWTRCVGIEAVGKLCEGKWAMESRREAVMASGPKKRYCASSGGVEGVGRQRYGVEEQTGRKAGTL